MVEIVSRLWNVDVLCNRIVYKNLLGGEKSLWYTESAFKRTDGSPQLVGEQPLCMQIFAVSEEGPTWVKHGYIDPVVSKEKTISTGPPVPASALVVGTGSSTAHKQNNKHRDRQYGIYAPPRDFFVGLASSDVAIARFFPFLGDSASDLEGGGT